MEKVTTAIIGLILEPTCHNMRSKACYKLAAVSLVPQASKATSSISPKHWHPVLLTQVDILVHPTCNTFKYCFWLVPCLWDWFSDLLCHPWFWFSEHLGLTDIERFVPLEDVYYEIHGSICKCHDFQMGNWKVFNGMCNALYYKPWGLKNDKLKRLSKPIAFPPVLGFCLGWHNKFGVTIALHGVFYL